MENARRVLAEHCKRLSDQLTALEAAIVRCTSSEPPHDRRSMPMPTLDLPAEVVAHVLESWRESGWQIVSATDSRGDVYLDFTRNPTKTT